MKFLSLKLVAVASFVLIALSVFYYLVIFLPTQERTRKAELSAKVNQEKHEKCLEEAEEKYNQYMAPFINALKRGENWSGPGVTETINNIDESLRLRRISCREKYLDS